MGLEHFDAVYFEHFEDEARKSTLEKRVKQAYPILKEVAKKREKIEYGEVMNKIGTGRRYIGKVIKAIAICEKKQGNPLLSAVVIRKDTKKPGGGFFGLPGIPKELKRSGSELKDAKLTKSETAFWREELERVHEYWGYWG